MLTSHFAFILGWSLNSHMTANQNSLFFIVLWYPYSLCFVLNVKQVNQKSKWKKMVHWSLSPNTVQIVLVALSNGGVSHLYWASTLLEIFYWVLQYWWLGLQLARFFLCLNIWASQFMKLELTFIIKTSSYFQSYYIIGRHTQPPFYKAWNHGKVSLGVVMVDSTLWVTQQSLGCIQCSAPPSIKLFTLSWYRYSVILIIKICCPN